MSFANQCTIDDNGSSLPKTEALLSHISVSKNQIIRIIGNFNSNKAYGCDGISVAMLKLCAVEAYIPLQMIFNDCINYGMFPDAWKYAIVQPVHKKITVKLKVIIEVLGGV